MDINFFEDIGFKVELVEKIPKNLNRKDFLVIKGGKDKFNRMVVSSKYVDILLDPHLGKRRDFIHHRNSGLNQVLCKLAKQNNVAIGFSFSSILDSKDRGRSIGRIMQNIRICRKYKVPIVIGSFAKTNVKTRNFTDIQSFFKIIGMTGKEVKNLFIAEKLDYKKRYIKKGVMRIK
jgi:RNase P/RNase MRP subunit p30